MRASDETQIHACRSGTCDASAELVRRSRGFVASAAHRATRDFALRASMLLMAASLGAADGQAATVEFRLPSGLQVILRPVFSASDVAVVVLFDVGELDDPAGQSGLGHLVEHIYVTAATATTPQRSARQLMEDYPKGWNAQTGDDYTVVASVVSPDRLDGELQQAAQRMGKLRIEQADLDRERPRVLDEVSNMFERVAPLAARNHTREQLHPRPDGGRHGGRPEHLKQITLSHVRQHWEDYYKAGNARLVIAGSIDPKTLEPKVRQAFGEVAAGRPLPARPAAAPPSFGQTRIRRGGKSSGAVVCLAYDCPPPNSKLFPAFLVLLARLQESAMKLGGAPTELPVTFAPLDDCGTVYVITTAKEGETPDQAVGRLSRLIEEAVDAGKRPVSPSFGKQQFAFLLDTWKVPDLLLRSNVYGVAFGLGRRRQLGINGEQLAAEMDLVKREAILECARQYFAEDRRAVAVVEQ